MNKEVSAPMLIAAVVIVVALAGFFLFKGVTGGVQGNGKDGDVQPGPNIPASAMQKMRQNQPQGGTSGGAAAVPR